MTPKLTAEQLSVLHASGDQPMPVVDPMTNHIYLVVDPSKPDEAIEALRQSEDMLAIREGLAQMEAGEGTPVAESFDRIRDNLHAKYSE